MPSAAALRDDTTLERIQQCCSHDSKFRHSGGHYPVLGLHAEQHQVRRRSQRYTSTIIEFPKERSRELRVVVGLIQAGLSVAIKCKLSNGESETKATAAVEEGGSFNV